MEDPKNKPYPAETDAPKADVPKPSRDDDRQITEASEGLPGYTDAP